MSMETGPKPRKKFGGFGLVKALITVASFSVFAALLLNHLYPPKQSLCAGNMHQLSLALTQYTQENDQSFPPKFYEGPQGWAGRIYPYIKNAAPYKCPEDTTVTSGTAAAVSYGINSNLVGQLPQVTAPADTVLLFEVSGAQVEVNKLDEGSSSFKHQPPSKMLSPCGRGLPDEDGGYPAGQWGTQGQITYATGGIGNRSQLTGARNPPRHSSGSNFLGVDGHVAYLLPAQVSSGADGTPGRPQSQPQTNQAAATNTLFLPDGTTPVLMTFSTK